MRAEASSASPFAFIRQSQRVTRRSAPADFHPVPLQIVQTSTACVTRFPLRIANGEPWEGTPYNRAVTQAFEPPRGAAVKPALSEVEGPHFFKALTLNLHPRSASRKWPARKLCAHPVEGRDGLWTTEGKTFFHHRDTEAQRKRKP